MSLSGSSRVEVERTLEDCRTAVNPLVSLADRDDCARQKTFSNTLVISILLRVIAPYGPGPTVRTPRDVPKHRCYKPRTFGLITWSWQDLDADDNFPRVKTIKGSIFWGPWQKSGVLISACLEEVGIRIKWPLSILWSCLFPNRLTPKIWLSVIPFSCYIFPYKLVTKIWCWIKIATSTW